MSNRSTDRAPYVSRSKRSTESRLRRKGDSNAESDSGANPNNVAPTKNLSPPPDGSNNSLAYSINGGNGGSVNAGRYHIQETIGCGGMGVVLRAYDPDLQRPLAVKVMQSEFSGDEAARARFLAEARVTGQLQHPGIPPIHELGRFDDGRFFFSMKLIREQTLEQMLAQRTCVQQDATRIIGIFENICQTIAYAHSHGVLHRDLKPENVMVGAFGEVQVMDWGLAKTVNKGSWLCHERTKPSQQTTQGESIDGRNGAFTTLAGELMGTPAYMAPEQARGEIEQLDERCDVFGLGGILCCILTGKPTFDDVDPDVEFDRIERGDVSDAIMRLDECKEHAPLVELAKRCLSPDKVNRPRHAGKVAQAVEEYRRDTEQRLRQAEIERRQVEVQAKEERKRREVEQARLAAEHRSQAAELAKAKEEEQRRRLTVLLLAVLLLLVAGAGAVAFWHQRNQTAQLQISAEKRHRHDLLNQAIRDSIKEAHKHRKDLHAILKDPSRGRELTADPARWEGFIKQANAALSQAEKLRSNAESPIDKHLLADMRQLKIQLAGDEEDRQFYQELAAIRSGRLLVTSGSDLDHRSARDAYAKTFRDAGYRFEPGHEESNAKRLKNSAVRDHVIAAMGDFALVLLYKTHADDEDLLAKVLHVVGTVDDRTWWRRFWEFHTWRDAKHGQQLATEAMEKSDFMLTESPQLLILAGSVLHSNMKNRIAWFQRARDYHPSDFWINFNLANALHNIDARRSIESHKVCVALRPDSVAVHNNYAVALMRVGNCQLAAKHYAKAAKIRPDHAGVQSNLGAALIECKELKAAETALTRALTIDPTHSMALINLGAVYEKMDHHARAIATYSKIIDLYPKNRLAHCNLGGLFSRRKKHLEAEKCFLRYLRFRPRDVHIRIQLANCQMKLKKHEAATEVLRKALDYEPNNAHVHNNLGAHAYRNNKTEQSVAMFKKAIALNPNLADAHQNLSLAYNRLGRPKEALAAIRTAVALKPNSAKYHSTLGTMYSRQRRYTEAEAALRKGVELNPNYRAGWWNLSKFRTDRGKWRSAETALEKAIQLEPKAAKLHRHLGIVRTESKKYAKAAEAFQRAISLAPKRADIHLDYALMLLRSNELEKSVKQLKRTIQVAPEYAPAHERLGGILFRLGKLDDAIKLVRRATELEPKYARGHRILGVLLGEKGDRAGQFREFRMAVQLAPNDAENQHHYGLILRLRNDYAGAEAAQRKAIALNPRHAAAHVSLGFIMSQRKDLDRAVECFRKAAKYDEELFEAHVNLGYVLYRLNELQESVNSFRKAIPLRPRQCETHIGLGQSYLKLGKFVKSEAALINGLKIMPKRHPMQGVARNLLMNARKLQGVSERIESVLKGAKSTPRERMQIAALCVDFKQRYVAAAQLYVSALAEEMKAGKSPASGKLIQAARASALAAQGIGIDAGGLNAAAKDEWRKLALRWLREDVARIEQKLDTRKPMALIGIDRKLTAWRTDKDFDSLRPGKHLAKSSHNLQSNCRQFWSRVDQLINKVNSRCATTTENGELADNRKAVVYPVRLTAGETVVIEMKSKQLDPLVRFEDVKGTKLAEHDDINTKRQNYDARLIVTPAKSGEYRIVATSFRGAGRGRFTITIRQFEK